VSPPQWGGVWGGGIAPSAENLSISSRKMATFSAFWALFLQFIVHSSMDCLKRFRRQKPLLVGRLAVVCMQIALGDKTSVLETTLWFMRRKISWGLGRGYCPSPENFSILSLKMATFSAFWALAHVAPPVVTSMESFYLFYRTMHVFNATYGRFILAWHIKLPWTTTECGYEST